MISIIKRFQPYNFFQLIFEFTISQYKINFFYSEQLLLCHNHTTTNTIHLITPLHVKKRYTNIV